MNKKMVLLVSVFALIAVSWAPAVAAPQQPRVPIIVDADIGVDDAAALAYLLSSSKANILGITTVAGNTSVENAANNALILLDTAQRTAIPVVVGAAAPLVVSASHQGVFVHGPDGLWGLSVSIPAARFERVVARCCGLPVLQRSGWCDAIGVGTVDQHCPGCPSLPGSNAALQDRLAGRREVRGG